MVSPKKKKSWFHQLKRLFITDTISSGTEKKDKKRKWMFGKFRSKRLASITAPSPPQKPTENVAEELQQKCPSPAGLSQRNTQDSRSCSNPEPPAEECEKKSWEVSDINALRYVAAIKIQSAFRGYLARKALRALKGLVKLQAIIRGWAVRRQAMNTLKRLQTIINIQSEFCAKRCDLVKNTLQETEKDIKIDSNSQKRWDDSALSKEEANAVSMNKKVASIRRDRVKEYWLNHRRSTESEQSKFNVKQRYWLEQWVDTQLAKREDLQNMGAFNSGNARNKDEVSNRRLRLRNLQKNYQIEVLDSPVMHVPRRSFDRRRQLSIGGDSGSFVGSPAVPTYMAATESAKAKARSMSSPRLRSIHFDAYSEINSPYKHKLSPISSINSELTTCSQIGRHIAFSQRSPCLKGTSGPIKSSRSLNNDQLNA